MAANMTKTKSKIADDLIYAFDLRKIGFFSIENMGMDTEIRTLSVPESEIWPFQF